MALTLLFVLVEVCLLQIHLLESVSETDYCFMALAIVATATIVDGLNSVYVEFPVLSPLIKYYMYIYVVMVSMPPVGWGIRPLSGSVE